MTSRRQYLSTLALLTAGCNSLGGDDATPTDGDGSPTSGEDTQTGTATPTPLGEVESISTDSEAVAWAAKMPETISWAPAVHEKSKRVFVGLGRGGLGTPDEADPELRHALFGLAAGDGSEAWRKTLDAPVANDLSVNGDSLDVVTGYSTGNDGVQQRVHAFGTGGSQNWVTDPQDASLTVLGGNEDSTFVATGDQLLALGSDGSQQWATDAGDVQAGAIVNGIFVVDNGGKQLAGYARDGGDEQWTAAGKALGNPENSLVTVDSLAFARSTEEDKFDNLPLVAYSVEDGSEAWSYAPNTGQQEFVPKSLAALDEGDAAVVGTTASGMIFALAADGSEVWQTDAGFPIDGPVHVGESVYVRTTGNEIVAFDPASGEEQWRYDAAGSRLTTRVADSGLFVFPGRNGGDVLAAVGADGEEQWTFELPSGVRESAVAGDRLYTVVESRSLYAFDLGA